MILPHGMTEREARDQLRRDNKRYGYHLTQIDIPPDMAARKFAPVEAWRSADFLVQVFAVKAGIERLSVCRTDIKAGRWTEGISWDDLQRLKHDCGRGDFDAVEVFPRDKDVVNVANMRHLWVFRDALIEFAWRDGVLSEETGKVSTT